MDDENRLWCVALTLVMAWSLFTWVRAGRDNAR